MSSKQKVGIVTAVLILFSFATFSPSSAASNISKSQALKAVKGIKSELTKTKLNISSLRSKEISESNEAYRSASTQLGKLQSEYDVAKKELEKAKSEATAKLSELSVFKVMVDNISACGANFQTKCSMNQTISFPSTAKVDVDFLMKIGGIVPVDELAYKNTKTIISAAEDSLVKLEGKFNKDKADNQALYANNVSEIQARYGQLTIKAEDYQLALEGSLLAATRASKATGNYLSAFKNAYVFDFNYKSITIVAKTPFSDIDSFISLNVVRDAVKYAALGDAIDSKYSDAKAKSFNSYYGDTFYEDQFESDLASSLNIYKKFAK